jgi:hypothetical protein
MVEVNNRLKRLRKYINDEVLLVHTMSQNTEGTDEISNATTIELTIEWKQVSSFGLKKFI